MSRILVLSFPYGEEICSCLVSFVPKNDGLEVAISNIFAERYNIFTGPVSVNVRDGKVIPDELLCAQLPIIKAVEKSLNQYLKHGKGSLAST